MFLNRYVFLACTQLAHSSQNTADMELVGSTRVPDDFFNVLFSNLIVFTPEISLTIALIVRVESAKYSIVKSPYLFNLQCGCQEHIVCQDYICRCTIP